MQLEQQLSSAPSCKEHRRNKVNIGSTCVDADGSMLGVWSPDQFSFRAARCCSGHPLGVLSEVGDRLRVPLHALMCNAVQFVSADRGYRVASEMLTFSSFDPTKLHVRSNPTSRLKLLRALNFVRSSALPLLPSL